MMKEKLNLEQWVEAISRFSEINRNRLTRIEVMGRIGDLERDYWLENGLPLMGIGVDMKGQNGPLIQIMLEAKNADGGHLTRVISNARTVTVELGYEGQFDSLQIEDMEGAKTILRFESNATAASA